MDKHNIYPGRTRSLLVIYMLAILFPAIARAEDGMWIPMLLEKYKIGDLKKAGLEIGADEIYSINQACLKDAVVIFGRGCTGEVISPEGLLLTNHHCGEHAVQSHSSVENDYLKNGFWAMNKQEELPNPGLTATFLRYMKDVSGEVLAGTQGLDPDEKERKMELNTGEVIREATHGNNYDANVKAFYYGNAYYLFVYEVFRDIRLVGAPPVSIGNYGADQDNWEWPRHTGDFTLFRIYAGEENQPADYAPGNHPYKPGKYLEIDAGGIEEGDFTMILGYPGSTSRYLYSEAVKQMINKSLPLKIGLRSRRLEIMDRYMRASDTVRIQYATKYRDVSNSWKKWQGIILGLDRNMVIDQKIRAEEDFTRWVNEDGERQLKYDSLLPRFERIYGELEPYQNAMDMLNEAIMAVELYRMAPRIRSMMIQGLPADQILDRVDRLYKDYHMPIDREVFGMAMKAYRNEMPSRFVPSFLEIGGRKYKGEYSRFADVLFKKTLFAEKAKVQEVIEQYRKDAGKAIQMVEKDPVIIGFIQFRELYVEQILPGDDSLENELEKTYHTYMAALMEKAMNRRLAPDANFTMRLTYGNVEGYTPRDGIRYDCSTTLSGIIEKSSEGFEDYRIPLKLKELYEEKEFGRYGVNGSMPVCFIASNHTSGGNSGSPVLDSKGRLIGLNFDRNWEGTMSDVYYDPSLCRNIAVDIRYVLFIIDKFAGASYLVDEMEIVW